MFWGAIIESETTAQTLGKEGVRKSSPMANLDFIVVPLGKYLKNHQKFGNSLKYCPKVFSTNYFLKGKDGNYLNGMLDKLCWVIWAEGRTHGDYSAIKTPIGFIPVHDDLKMIFKEYLDKDYSEKEYVEQFSLRTIHLIEKLNRIEEIYKTESNVPDFFWNILYDLRDKLRNLKIKHGKEEISPLDFL